MIKLGTKLMQVVYGEIIFSILTIIVTYAFFTSSTLSIIRNVVIVALIFLGVYIGWIKLNKKYEKIYKFGLKEE